MSEGDARAQLIEQRFDVSRTRLLERLELVVLRLELSELLPPVSQGGAPSSSEQRFYESRPRSMLVLVALVQQQLQT